MRSPRRARRVARSVPPVLGNDDWRVRRVAVRGLARRRTATCSRAARRRCARASQLQHPEQRTEAVRDDRRRRHGAARGAAARRRCRSADPGGAGAGRAAPARRRSRRWSARSRILMSTCGSTPSKRSAGCAPMRRSSAGGDRRIGRLLPRFAALEALALIRDPPRRARPGAAARGRASPWRSPGAQRARRRQVGRAAGRALNRAARAAVARRRDRRAIADRSRAARASTIARSVRESLSAAGRAHADGGGSRPPSRRCRPSSRVLGWCEGPSRSAALTRCWLTPAGRGEVVEALVRQGERQWSTAGRAAGRRGPSDAARGDRRARPVRQPARDACARRAARRPAETSIVAAAGALARHRRSGGVRAAAGAARRTAMRRSARRDRRPELDRAPDMPARIAALLGDADPLVRESAVRIAGYFGYPEAVATVLALRRRCGRNGPLRRARAPALLR